MVSRPLCIDFSPTDVLLILGILLGGLLLVVGLGLAYAVALGRWWVRWALSEQHPLLERVEWMFPVKGRWLRYLAAGILYPVTVLLPLLVVVGLWGR